MIRRIERTAFGGRAVEVLYKIPSGCNDLMQYLDVCKGCIKADFAENCKTYLEACVKISNQRGREQLIRIHSTTELINSKEEEFPDWYERACEKLLNKLEKRTPPRWGVEYIVCLELKRVSLC